jgi:hypothetical protein
MVSFLLAAFFASPQYKNEAILAQEVGAEAEQHNFLHLEALHVRQGFT